MNIREHHRRNHWNNAASQTTGRAQCVDGTWPATVAHTGYANRHEQEPTDLVWDFRPRNCLVRALLGKRIWRRKWKNWTKSQFWTRDRRECTSTLSMARKDPARGSKGRNPINIFVFYFFSLHEWNSLLAHWSLPRSPQLVSRRQSKMSCYRGHWWPDWRSTPSTGSTGSAPLSGSRAGSRAICRDRSMAKWKLRNNPGKNCRKQTLMGNHAGSGGQLFGCTLPPPALKRFFDQMIFYWREMFEKVNELKIIELTK